MTDRPDPREEGAGGPGAPGAPEPAEPAAAREAEERYLLVEVGEERCVLPLARVRRIVRDLQVTPLPGAAAELQGLAELGGEPLPVVDLGRLLGIAPGASPAYPVTVIVWAGRADARELVGLEVDAALEVVSVEPEAIAAGGEGLVRGDVSLGGRPVRVISLTALGGPE